MGELDKASLVINIDLATRVRFPHPVYKNGLFSIIVVRMTCAEEVDH
jgi:hypothetical protein